MATRASSISTKIDEIQPRPSRLLRFGWLLVFVLIVALQLGGIPFRYREALDSPKTIMSAAGGDPTLVKSALDGAGISHELYALYDLLTFGLSPILLIVIATLIFFRRANDRSALLISFLLLLGSYGTFPSALLESTGKVGMAVNRLFELMTGCAVYIIFFVFPNGRFVPYWTRLAGLFYLFIITPTVVFPGSRFDINQLMAANPLWLLSVIPLYGSMIYAPIYRYIRVSSPIERLQIRWVVVGLVAVPLAWIINGFLLPQIAPGLREITLETIRYHILINLLILQPLYLAFPLGLGISLLRYRLYDLDVIIRRTLVYGALTGILALLYFGGVILFQKVFTLVSGGTGQSQAAIVLSTLTIAALFTPLRKRIQAFIDRRFYRSKYNAEHTLQAFSRAARDEVNLEQLETRLKLVVQDTLQPESISLWIRKPATK